MLFDPTHTRPSSSHFIGGAFYDAVGAGEMDVRSASDPSLKWVLKIADANVVDDAVQAAKQAISRSGWATMNPRKRGGILKRWSKLIEENVEEIAQLEAMVSTRTYKEALSRDVLVAADCVAFFAEYADKSEGSITATETDALSLSMRQPHGVVAAIAPWNFPLILSAWKYAPALAAGNAVVLKPSELTPFSVIKIAELAVEAGVPAGIFNVIQGDGISTGAPLVAHPDIDYVSFTGSTATGIAIATSAIQTGLKPFSLELGGKGAQVVFADAPDLDNVVEMVARGICLNAGQVCFAGSRLVIEQSIETEFLEKLTQKISAPVPGPSWDDKATLAPIMNAKQLGQVEDIVIKSQAQGAELVVGGNACDGPLGAAYFEPTVLRRVTDNTAARQQEIFGPVLTVQTFTKFDEAIALADHPEYALASAVHTRDINKAITAARRIEAGTVWVNDWGRKADITSPFGGFKRSGQGKDLGRPGFEKYLKSKSIWMNTKMV